MSQAERHCNQSPCRSTLADWYGHARKAGIPPRIAALPAPSKVDVILMACGDVQMGVHSHGCCSPGFEVGSVGGLGHMVQQPGGHMAQLMAQRALQLLRTVQHLCAQLHSGCVPAGCTVTQTDSWTVKYGLDEGRCSFCYCTGKRCRDG